MSTPLPFARTFGAAAILATLTAASATAAPGPLQATSRIAPSFESAAVIGDFNGDGKADQAVSGFTAGSGYSVSVIFGGASFGSVNALNPGAAGARFVPGASTTTLGGVEAAGDVDHDGYADLLVTASAPVTVTSTDSTVAWVIYGAPGGGGTTTTLAPGGRMTAITLGNVGSGVGGLGDFNGDGFDDIALSWGTGLFALNNTVKGAAIFYGGPRAASVSALAQGARVSRFTGLRSCKFEWLLLRTVCTSSGANILPVGDFNGDGKSDVFLGTGRPEGRNLFYGRTGTFTIPANAPGAGSTRLGTPPTSDNGFFEETDIQPAGDVNGDGIGDLLYPGYSAGKQAESVILGRKNPAALIAFTDPKITLTTTFGYRYAFAAAGDRNGDGKGDLFAYLPIGRGESSAVRLTTSLPAPGGTLNLTDQQAVGGLPLDLRQGPTFGGNGDLDGDGALDALFVAPGRGIYQLTHGADKLAPEFIPDDVSNAKGLSIVPAAFEAAQGAQLMLTPSEAATVELSYKTAAGAAAGTEVRSVAYGPSTTAWKATVNGTTLAPGRYTVDATLVDTAGNRGASRRAAFEVKVPGGPPRTTALFTWTVKGPSGELAPGVDLVITTRCTAGRFDTGGNPANGATFRVGDDGSLTAGSTCTVHAITNQYPTTGAYALCQWRTTTTWNGAPLSSPDGYLTTAVLQAGENRWDQLTVCVPKVVAPGTTPTSFADLGWDAAGNTYPNTYSGNILTLTSDKSQTSSLVWRPEADYRNKTIAFNAYLSGGNGAAEGFTLAFLRSTAGKPSGLLGAGLGGLGFGGLDGVALAFDVNQQATDPSSNFIGLADGSKGDSLNYVQTADPGIRLRGTGGVKVKVVSKSGVVSVYINDKLRLQRTMTLPSPAHLAFTASTGATIHEQHQLVGLAVTDS